MLHDVLSEQSTNCNAFTM